MQLERDGDLEGALALYSKILASDPDNVKALSGAAVCFVMLNRYDEALAVQERLVELDPDDAQVRIELGFNYLNHQSRPRDALRVLGEAVTISPSAKNLCFLAQAQGATGDLGSAETNLRQAISIEPSYAYSYRLLASMLEGQGRAEEAQQVLDQATSLGVNATGTS